MISSDFPKKQVVIVGGGLAGLSAAESLVRNCEAKCDVTLLESKRTAGGRAGSFDDPHSDETIDYCQHVMMGCCTELLDLLRRNNLLERFTRYPKLTFYHPRHGFSNFSPSRWLPAPLHLAPALLRLKHLSMLQKHRIALAILRLMRTPPSHLQHQTAGDWLSSTGQDKESCERFWDVILVSALGETTSKVSMLMARKVILDGFAAARSASDVWVPNQPLSEIFGVSLPDRLVAKGVKLRTGLGVKTIVERDDKNTATVVLSDGSQLAADHVILATSWRSSRRLLSGLSGVCDSIEKLDEIESSPITGLHLWLDRPLTPLPHVAMVGTVAHWLFRQPVQEPGPPPNASPQQYYHQVVISGRHELSDASTKQLVGHVLEELKTAFPETSNVKLLRSKAVTDPHAVYQVSPKFLSQRLATKTHLRWLSLAGDHVETGWPATMEGAAISGVQAAAAACECLGIRANVRPAPPLKSGWLARCLVKS